MNTTSYGECDSEHEKVTPTREKVTPAQEKVTLRGLHDDRIGRFPERLKEVIGNESLRGFARRSHLSESVLRSYIRGDTSPTLDRLDAIAFAAGVSPGWLGTEEGHDKTEGQQSSPAHEIDEDMLRNMIRKLEALIEESGEEWTPDAKARLIARAYREEKEDESLPEKERNIIRLVKSA